MATVVSPPEQSVVIANVRWRTYLNLLEDLAESSSPRLTFDRRTFEITSPTKKHERLNRVLVQLVEVLTDELGIDMENLGSATFKREDLERGFEPDSCFYFEQAALVRSKEELDLSVDPSPELVIEIDVTSTSIHKDPVYAQLGVREVWRYDGNELRIAKLVGKSYVVSERSATLPLVTATVLTQFLESSRTATRPELVKSFRQWIRDNTG
ncbi:MAG: Uma2 family endonuclease [Acidobacteria bacterium]|nr:MAG: Uma2 family endonuclease [Acidobacteriota bacterium]